MTLAASTRGYITSRCLACIGQHIQRFDRLRQRTRPLRCRVCPPAALLHRHKLWRSRLDAHVLLPDAWLVLVHRLRDTPTSSSTTIFGNQFPAARSSTTNFEPFLNFGYGNATRDKGWACSSLPSLRSFGTGASCNMLRLAPPPRSLQTVS